MGKSSSVPKAMEDKYNEITNVVKAFCGEHLDGEYYELCSKLCAALCRKRPSPLVNGRSNGWACGIVHAIGMVNFLFDESQVPHMKASELYKAFGVSSSTGGTRSKEIRNMMKLSYFDPEWTLPSLNEDNPLAWMLDVDGILMDVRNAPREIQEIAFAKGLIPYIPGDKTEQKTLSNVIPFENYNKKLEDMNESEKLKLAQDKVEEAFNTQSPKRRIELAEQAIDISENCVDAYMFLFYELHPSFIKKRKNLLERAVQAGKNIIGDENFKKYKGNFWMVYETRPYMAAKFQLADFLWHFDERIEAIKHGKELLELNPNDNQGVRQILINWVIFENNDEYARNLLKVYEDDCSASMVFGKALLLYKTGQIKEAEKALKEAIDTNPHVPKYITGKMKLPDTMPEFVGLGDENEAIVYAYDAIEVWKNIQGAIDWMMKIH